MSGFEWVHCKRGDPLPQHAVLAGNTSSDGPNFVARVHVGVVSAPDSHEAGKVNLKDGRVWNFWVHKSGEHHDGQVLIVLPGYQASWMHRKKGDQLPQEAVYAGTNLHDGHHYACRHGGAAGKVTVNGKSVNQYWMHGNWFGKDDGDVCVVMPLPGGGGMPQPSAPPTYPMPGGGFAPQPSYPMPGGGAPQPWAPPAQDPYHSQPDQPNWNPNAMCDGTRAEDRVRWLMDNQRHSKWDAQAQVMREFPHAFPHGEAHGGPWNPDAMCDGSRAEDRMRWLMDNQRMSQWDAQAQVMREFPHAFHHGQHGHAHGGHHEQAHGGHWDPHAMCDGTRAEDRMRWLMDNQRMSMGQAQAQVMRKFPRCFTGSQGQGPLVPSHFVEPFIDALRKEYMHRHQNAVGDFFSQMQVPGEVTQVLDRYEQRFRGCPDHGELDRIKAELLGSGAGGGQPYYSGGGAPPPYGGYGSPPYR